MHLTVTSLQCQCLSWLMIDRGNLRKSKPTKTQNQIKRKPRWNGETRVILRSRSGCKNSGKIWWIMKLIPLQGGSHASSSHEVSLEPRTKRREDLGKHNVHIHFPKDRNCEICKRTKITRRRRNGEAVPRAANFGDLITADHKVLSDNCESRNNHRYAVVVQDPATQWIQAYPCKTKLHKKPRAACKSSLNPRGNQKSFTLKIPWNSAKLMKISPGIIARLHHTDRRLMVLRKEQCAE